MLHTCSKSLTLGIENPPEDESSMNFWQLKWTCFFHSAKWNYWTSSMSVPIGTNHENQGFSTSVRKFIELLYLFTIFFSNPSLDRRLKAIASLVASTMLRRLQRGHWPPPNAAVYAASRCQWHRCWMRGVTARRLSDVLPAKGHIRPYPNAPYMCARMKIYVNTCKYKYTCYICETCTQDFYLHLLHKRLCLLVWNKCR